MPVKLPVADPSSATVTRPFAVVRNPTIVKRSATISRSNCTSGGVGLIALNVTSAMSSSSLQSAEKATERPSGTQVVPARVHPNEGQASCPRSAKPSVRSCVSHDDSHVAASIWPSQHDPPLPKVDWSVSNSVGTATAARASSWASGLWRDGPTTAHGIRPATLSIVLGTA